jgi:hypothetical protein
MGRHSASTMNRRTFLSVSVAATAAFPANKVPDLDQRWEVDALELKPAVLSILVGVNDIWHKTVGI